MKIFNEWYRELTGNPPHPWQDQMGSLSDCPSRLVRIPTGFGKTMGALSVWMYHRLYLGDNAWPRRLLWVLPMRVLVEQTADEAQKILTAAKRLLKTDEQEVGVHILMGGVSDLEWQNKPEACAILVGTHDMLLSRALNRGYAAPRARWPVEFGLLNHDTLWVMDEVQLMDVGLATSAQLFAFREQDRDKALRPFATWWMSATLKREWLTSVDTKQLIEKLPLTQILPEQRTEKLWKTTKPLAVQPSPGDAESIKETVLTQHVASSPGEYGRITLVILNTVDLALDVYKKLSSKRPAGVDIRLVHSRFRPHDRENWRTEFLCKDACKNADRIIVSTQVVEAGVDVSATTLITELAPWPSLVQRFGRAARWGGGAEIVVLTREFKNEKDALPYLKAELDTVRELALARVDSAAQASLEDFEAALSESERAQLYPYAPPHLLLRHEWEELFDTTPDLSGADIDISRFIRSGDERDVQVFWRELEKDEKTKKVKNPDPKIQPERDELCSVTFLKAQKWLCGDKGTRAEDAWVWDWLDEKWRPAVRRDFYPGQTVLVDAARGGYSSELGWSPTEKAPVADLSKLKKLHPVEPEIEADTAEAKETLSETDWKTIATHGREAGASARKIAEHLNLAAKMAELLDLAGRWHDIGKAHDCFQGSMRHADRPQRIDLAKAPKNAWPRNALYCAKESSEQRPGLRHELASMLALFAVLIRHKSDHAALLGPWRELLVATQAPLAEKALEKVAPPSTIEKEILALGAEDFDLLAYLVCAHHGKVRQALHASPADQDYKNAEKRGAPIRGICNGDVLPAVLLCGPDGAPEEIASLILSLTPAEAGLSHVTGRSWTERALELVRRHGPAKLAWLEALLRAADVRASKLETPDPLLAKEVQA